MKRALTVLTTLTLVAIIALPALAARGRKLPVGAYIKSAKIDIVSGDPERYEEAAAMLDSLFMHYGPHAEALYLYAQMMVDGLQRAPDPKAKEPYVRMMVAYMDSLHMCCEGACKEKYRDDCDEYIQKSDSIRVKYWREFYNKGIVQLNAISAAQTALKETQDSTMRIYHQDALQANYDSAIVNMNLAIMIDSSDNRSYLALGTAYQAVENYDKAIKYKKLGLKMAPTAEDSVKLLESIAYDYINQGNYEDAIPYLNEYIVNNPGDPATMYNLTICLNNVGMYDSAKVIFDHILEVDPLNADALSGIGRYFNELGRMAADSARQAEAAGDEAAKEKWLQVRQNRFDSSRVYLRRAYKNNPDDPFVTEMYALAAALSQNWENAAEAFRRLTELQPDVADHWISLGDCLVNLQDWEASVVAYEKAVELKPDKKQIWEQLADLYQQLGMRDKEAEARAKLK